MIYLKYCALGDGLKAAEVPQEPVKLSKVATKAQQAKDIAKLTEPRQLPAGSTIEARPGNHHLFVSSRTRSTNLDADASGFLEELCGLIDADEVCGSGGRSRNSPGSSPNPSPKKSVLEVETPHKKSAEELLAEEEREWSRAIPSAQRSPVGDDGRRLDGRPDNHNRRGSIYDKSEGRTVDFDVLRRCLKDRGYALNDGDSEKVADIPPPVPPGAFMDHVTPDVNAAMVLALTPLLSDRGAVAFISATKSAPRSSARDLWKAVSGDESSSRSRRRGNGGATDSSGGASPVRRGGGGQNRGRLTPNIRPIVKVPGEYRAAYF